MSGLSAADVEARWVTLISKLRTHVACFPALPTADPGRSDIAYCLFLHALAVRTMRFSAAWPAAVAARLGIAGPGRDETPGQAVPAKAQLTVATATEGAST